MKYIVMASRQFGQGVTVDEISAQYSGIVHDTREEARKEMASITAASRNELMLDHVWIKEVEE